MILFLTESLRDSANGRVLMLYYIDTYVLPFMPWHQCY
jgi:hypothetical protein